MACSFQTSPGAHRPLKAPQTIVLLGDILELWGPDREDFFASIKKRSAALKHSPDCLVR
jgi:hypothetical protein